MTYTAQEHAAEIRKLEAEKQKAVKEMQRLKKEENGRELEAAGKIKELKERPTLVKGCEGRIVFYYDTRRSPQAVMGFHQIGPTCLFPDE